MRQNLRSVSFLCFPLPPHSSLPFAHFYFSPYFYVSLSSINSSSLSFSPVSSFSYGQLNFNLYCIFHLLLPFAQTSLFQPTIISSCATASTNSSHFSKHFFSLAPSFSFLLLVPFNSSSLFQSQLFPNFSSFPTSHFPPFSLSLSLIHSRHSPFSVLSPTFLFVKVGLFSVSVSFFLRDKRGN